MRLIAVALLAAVAVVPAQAKMPFAAYDGPPQIYRGHGGTKLDNHGVDVWTEGKPAHRFQLLGYIDDVRQDKLLSGDAISSGSIAKRVKEVGGDAVIVGRRNFQAAGFATTQSLGVYGNTAIQNGGGRIIHNIATRLVVVKYLPDDGPAQDAP